MKTPIEILMIEDNQADIELTREALQQGKLNNNLYAVNDGEAAIDYLLKQGDYKNAVSPDMILLDLNLPKINGHEVLAEIKSNDALKSTPVVILSSSTDTKDIQSSYALNANSFVTKPVKVDDFLAAVQQIENFWIEIVKLPSGKN